MSLQGAVLLTEGRHLQTSLTDCISYKNRPIQRKIAIVILRNVVKKKRQLDKIGWWLGVGWKINLQLLVGNIHLTEVFAYPPQASQTHDSRNRSKILGFLVIRKN